jgi:glycosyltransferase involved in cell wall biosynthesis/rhamnogalacturonyl hydrolase YesR
MERKIEQSLSRLAQWVEDHDFKAYDPGDGQMSFLRALTFEKPVAKRLLTGVVLRAPFNVRPLMGIRPHTSTKGMGYMAWGYTKLFKLTGNAEHARRAKAGFQWLIENRSKNYPHFCWGNSFDFSTRAGTIPRGEPTIVWSGLIGQAFVEGYEVFGDAKYLEVASSICDWILTLPSEKTKTGTCLSYVAYNQVSIHNSNMLGGALLARVGSLVKRPEFLELAEDSMLYSCSRINADGGWYYGEAPKYHWIDNFHTGYNLDCLKRYIDSTGNKSFSDVLRRGFEYFKANFFEADGRSKYYHNKCYPIDIQCAAQAIDTLTFFSQDDPAALEQARKVADWTIDHMQSPKGFFYYRDLGWWTNKTPMLHWGQGTMFKALANLLTRLSKEGQRNEIMNVKENKTHEAGQGAAPSGLKYVLITPARNEEAYIGQTIESVIAQTVRPSVWVIVSDGSTDRTDEIVKQYAKDHKWIELVRMPDHRDRTFAAKANCFNAGYARLKGSEFDIIGNLDADITFEPDYFAFILGKFASLPKLGVGGTPYVEDLDNANAHTYAHQFAQLEHVSGACQMFRRSCFEQIGGYIPIKGGAIDWIAVTTARMKGWVTRTFTEKYCFHHRKLGTGTDSKLMVRFRYGQKAYYVGGHPLWEYLRGFFQMREKPRVLGGLYFISGFTWAMVTRMRRPVSKELMEFHRSEQMARLRRVFAKKSGRVEQAA